MKDSKLTLQKYEKLEKKSGNIAKSVEYGHFNFMLTVIKIVHFLEQITDIFKNHYR